MTTILKRITLLFLVTTIVLLIACNDDDSQIALQSLDYLPLQVGAKWVYESYNVDDNGDINVTSVDTLTVIGATITGEADLEGFAKT